MRRVAIILLVLLTCTQLHASETATARYNEGNARYRQGDFSGAVDRYEAALASGIAHADLYYNLGNAYFKLGAIGQALLNYERARRLAPADEDILENIAFANAARIDRFDTDEPNAVTRFLTHFYRLLSPNGLAIWVSFSFLLICVGIGGWMLGRHRRLLWILIATISTLGCLGGSILLRTKVHDLTAPEAIVLVEQVTGRSGPGDDYLQVFTLHEGTLVTLDRREGPWGLVRLPNGIGGWIRLDAVGMI